MVPKDVLQFIGEILGSRNPQTGAPGLVVTIDMVERAAATKKWLAEEQAKHKDAEQGGDGLNGIEPVAPAPAAVEPATA